MHTPPLKQLGDKDKQLQGLSIQIAELKAALQQKDGEKQRCEDELRQTRDDLDNEISKVLCGDIYCIHITHVITKQRFVWGYL